LTEGLVAPGFAWLNNSSELGSGPYKPTHSLLSIFPKSSRHKTLLLISIHFLVAGPFSIPSFLISIHFKLAKMDLEDQDYEEENTRSDTSADGAMQPRKPHNGGKIIREEPSNLREFQALELAVSCFRYLGCYEFCEQVERVQYHPELTRLFAAHLHDKKVTLARVTFTISSSIIVDATRIPNVVEKWFKNRDLDEYYYEPYIKPKYKN